MDKTFEEQLRESNPDAIIYSIDEPPPVESYKYTDPLPQRALQDLAYVNSLRDEADPNGKQPGEPGAKMDSGKIPAWQGVMDYFPRALLAVAQVSQVGAAKYSWKGWEQVANGYNRYSDAMGRHILNKSIEGKYDAEGFLHDAQIAWNALARLEIWLREEEDKI